ncbi:MAG: alpha/beta hydrolase [Cyclobacteriaceae bacterium]|nr:alpha/beta hydrolase [Cyclobacteriaceae bacterium]
MNRKYLFVILFIHFIIQVKAQDISSISQTVVYKISDTIALKMRVIYPPNLDKSQNYPGMVFFSGKWDHLNQFTPQATYFSSKGIVCFLVQHYDQVDKKDFAVWSRTANAKSSIRHIRANARQYFVDSDKLIAVGGSSGGHLAAASAFIQGCNDPEDDLSISPKPNALVLLNPVVDLGPIDPEIYGMLGEKYLEISPLQNITPNAPPTIILHGTADQFIPVSVIEYFRDVMRAQNNRCEVILYENQRHGFFDYKNSKEIYEKTLKDIENFLVSLDYIAN